MSTNRYFTLPTSGKYMKSDFTEKLVNEMLYDLLGKPGVSAGKAQNSITANAGTSGMSGESTSMYTAAQQDSYSGAGAGGTAIGAGIGLIRDLIGYAHADKAAKVAYNRQNEYYENHLSMPAKVAEYQEAGLNPMGLAGAGVGATSAPSVAQGETPAATAMVDVLGMLLNYKLESKAIAADINYKKSRTVAQNIENDYLRREHEQTLRNSEATYRKLTADANIAEITAIWCPQMLESQWKNSVADEALKKSRKELTDEQVKEVRQSIEQAKERFPQELENLKQNYAQMAALAYMYRTAGKNNEQEFENLKQQFANLEEQNTVIKKNADLLQTEIDTYQARNTTVTQDSETGMLIVKSPDGTITRFDPRGINKSTKHDLNGNRVKKK